MRITHTWSDETAHIGVQDLQTTVRVLHVTDAHIALTDERDSQFVEACQGRCEHWGNHRRDEHDKGIATSITFDEIMTQAGELELDLIALTGDIIDFPAQASVASAAASIAKANTPTLYTSGNHDWHFPTLEGREPLREAWWSALEPLHHGHAACQRMEIGGIHFLAFDNSTYQIEETQLEFLKTHLAASTPTVVLVHIPLSLPTLRTPTIARWQAPILIGDPDWDWESRNRWDTSEDTSVTLEFAQTVASAPNLVAVLCGHVHFPHVDSVSPWAAQYVGAPAFAGAKRLIEFHPLLL